MMKRNGAWRRTAVGALLAASLLLAACGGGTGGSGSSESGGNTGNTNVSETGGAPSGQVAYDPNAVVTLVTTADPTFNPWHPNAYAESNVLNEMILPGLTRWDANMKPQPDLATSWDVSDDGLTWTFHLRKDAKWSDGEPFTADDVAFTFNKIALNKKLGANHSSEFAAVDSVEAVDPHTAVFHLNQPFASLPSYLTYYSGILPKHIFDGVADPWSLNSFNKEHPVGTGPWMVSEYVQGSHVTLVPNPYYWGDKPKVKSIVWKIVPDANAQVAQLLSGDVSMLSLDDPTLADKFKNNPNLDIEQVKTNIYYFVTLNEDKPLFKDKRVRQALLLAINRKAMIQDLLKGYGEVATGPIPPLQATYYDPNVEKWSYDPDKAKQLLAEAGWKPGADGTLEKDGQPLVINMLAGQIRMLVPATLLVQHYWEAIGAKVNVKSIDWNSYIQQAIVKRDYEASLAWWSTPADPDVQSYYACSAAHVGNNIPNYCNPDVDKLLNEGRAATSEDQRVKIYNQLQEQLAIDLPYLYLWYPTGLVVHQKSLHMPAGSYAVKGLYSNEWYVAK